MTVESPPGAVRLVVVSDVRIYREGIAAILSRDDGFYLLNSPSLDVFGPEEIASTHPDVVLVDLAVSNVPSLVRALRERLPGAKLVALRVNDSEQEIIEFAEAGWTAYVSRHASVEELIDVLTSAARDELICSPRITAAHFRRVGSLASQRDSAEFDLTLREREVLALIRDDLANKQIAEQLQIAEATVKNHVHSLLEKLHVKRRAQAAKVSLATPGA